MGFGFERTSFLWVAVFVLVLVLCVCSDGCDLYEGSWVYDDLYPLYDPSSCPFIRKEFDCHKYGRPDTMFLKYKWQPADCDLPRFNSEEFLRRYKGKKIMYIGDSLSLNNWQSLVCVLHASISQPNITVHTIDSITAVTFLDYEVSVMLFHSLYLVDIEVKEIGRVMKLDSIKNGDIWKTMDVLIFNTWQWWGRRGTGQQWDYIQEGNMVYKDMDRMVAFQKGLMTWAKWVDSAVDTAKTTVFFQGISPSHYNGTDWNDPGVTNCFGQMEPIRGSTYPPGLPRAHIIVNEVLSTISKPVYLLDVTTLSQLRKDAHPSKYTGLNVMDCTHWCIPGLTDTWNQLLYAALMT
ncbi:hypothetical protein GIB67_004639 [Kingdonia uniflora]|uniref:Trichome birefringence-like N-terminal domain-containing protein n=1 Tax=Kingdonia uniflora TaxID=39325 RepID=A0A7J7MDE4_9MAGN|nr:hypothetical protein GIB67_004639 [Kingdonia uniflora]